MSCWVSSARDTTYRLPATRTKTAAQMMSSPVLADMARPILPPGPGRRRRDGGRCAVVESSPLYPAPGDVFRVSEHIVGEQIMADLEITAHHSESAVVLHATGQVDSRTAALLQ